MKEVLAPIMAILGIILIITGIIAVSNVSNETVDGGYSAYVYSEPMVGAKEFKQILNGPGGTGLVWRQDSIKISVTPYTMTETFDDIRAADQLKMKAEAYLVYRIDSNKIKEFVEKYGAISKDIKTPDQIANDAYESFIQQPFRTEVRSAIAQFKGLEAPAKIAEITKKVETNLRKSLEDSPFIIESITIGSTMPPESVTAGITKKVEATQDYERQAVQLEIAKRAEEIAIAEGRAVANKIEQEAKGEFLRQKQISDANRYEAEQNALAMLARKKAEAEGMMLEAKARKAMNDATGENYIRLKFVENLKDLKWPQTVITSGSDDNNMLKILNIADFTKSKTNNPQ